LKRLAKLISLTQSLELITNTKYYHQVIHVIEVREIHS